MSKIMFSLSGLQRKRPLLARIKRYSSLKKKKKIFFKEGLCLFRLSIIGHHTVFNCLLHEHSGNMFQMGQYY